MNRVLPPSLTRLVTSSIRNISACFVSPLSPIVATLFIASTCIAQASDDRVNGPITPVLTSPLAARGSVMVVPMRATNPDARWPETMDVRFSDRTIAGRIAFITNRPRDWFAWTQFNMGPIIGAEQPTADTADVTPVLLIEAPADASGAITIAGQSLQPVWLDVPAQLTLSPRAISGSLDLEPGIDRPDADSPFEYWRWNLLAHRLGRTTPAVNAYGDLGSMIARHHADLWVVGLSRLAAMSRGVAEECLDLLTHIARDGDTPFAAWATNEAELATLLGLLLDESRPDGQRLAAIVQWIDRQPKVLVWVRSSAGPTIELGVVNRSPEAVPVRFAWEQSDDIPVAIEAAPSRLQIVSIERPAVERPNPLDARTAVGEAPRQVLRVQTDTMTQSVVFGPRIVRAKPPGVLVSIARPALTLADVDRGDPGQPATDHTAAAQIRRLHGRWEIFVECRRPESAVPAGPVRVGRFESPAEIRGMEIVTIIISAGPFEDPVETIIAVPEIGSHRLYKGQADDTLELHRRRYTDRWLCRVVVPDAWLAPDDPTPVRFAFRRAHGRRDRVDAAPYASPPWRHDATGIAVDLTTW